MEESLFQEKLVKVAKTLGIETFGKKEEDIRKNILEHINPKPNVQTDKIDEMFRSLGKALGEYELMKNEFVSSITSETKSLSTVTTSRPMSIEKTLKLAKVLDIDVKGRGIIDVQKEIRRILEI